MSFLLKIVQGPNAGAEVALAEGVNLSFGSSDECDIVLSDSSVAEKAFELEVTGERVMALMPNGKAVKLEPYHVTMIGTSAVVVGPLEGTWKSLVWPKVEKVEDSSEDKEETNDAEEEETPPAKRRSIGCIVFLLFIAVLGLAVGVAYWKSPEKTKEYSKKAVGYVNKAWIFTVEKVKNVKAPKAVVAPKESLDAVAADCGFSVSGTDESPVAKGDFKTRVARLEATARAYAAKPGLKIDFADEESLSLAVTELLTLVSDEEITLNKVEGRKAFLSGYASSQDALERILRSISEDVPKISGADCSRVVIGTVASTEPTKDGSDSSTYKIPKMKRTRWAGRAGSPGMPVVGVLTVPYPCLVLSDGTRAMEGARFGEYTIEKIEADCVTICGADGAFEWRP